jgi:predicted Zn-dependent protease
MSPDSPDAHDVMGDLFLDALEPEAAEAEFRKARLVEAESSSGRTKLAEALRLQGKFDEAIRRTARGASYRSQFGSSARRARVGLTRARPDR